MVAAKRSIKARLIVNFGLLSARAVQRRPDSFAVHFQRGDALVFKAANPFVHACRLVGALIRQQRQNARTLSAGVGATRRAPPNERQISG
jgi:hypothetical protein